MVAHPLSILLTCRRVNDEATLLLFGTYSFMLEEALPFYDLRRRTLQLQRAQRGAVTSLSLSISQLSHMPNPSLEAFFTSTILLFPALKHIMLRVQIDVRSKQALTLHIRRSYDYASSLDLSPPSTYPYKRTPAWLLQSLEHVCVGKSCIWPEGEKWMFLDHFPCHAALCRHDVHAWSTKEVCTGVQIAELRQENGRTVKVGVVHEWEGDPVVESERVGISAVKLIPGAEKLEVTVLHGGKRIMYMPNNRRGEEKERGGAWC
jgi:hypothetical protein